MKTAAKRNDVIHTNVYQLIVPTNHTVVKRSFAEMPPVKRLNAVITNTVKDSFPIHYKHTNVNNKNVSLLNVLLPMTAVLANSAIK